MIEATNIGTFVTILLLTFALVMLVAGAFTAYFGSGKSRKIGGGLLGGGVVIGIVWVLLVRQGGPLSWILRIGAEQVGIINLIVQAILVLLAAFIGAGAAIGLFLLAIMKS